MKTNIHITFEGNLSELTLFLTDTFKNPESLTLSVTVGVEHVPAPVREVGYEEMLRQCTYITHSDKLHADYKVAVDHARNREKIKGIKQIREVTRWDLRTAKDFYEQVLIPAT